MKILALDSSGLVASVALVEDDTLLAEYTINHKKTHSQTLLPMVDQIVRMTELDLSTLDAIAVAGGPGSFTGLRIGSATAKGLAQALEKPIVSVPTLEGLAYNLAGADKLVCPLMDARRNQVYTGIYRFENGSLKTVLEQCAVGIDEILGRLCEIAGPAVLLGDGVPVFRERIEEKLTVPYELAAAHQNRQRAGSVGALAVRYMREGRFEAAAVHAPVYLRPSQAERTRAGREGRS